MSRLHLRRDKHCLNCGFVVEERYCSRCGQENVELKESLGHLVGHFFADITHFDSKIFTTLKDLVWRPGFLTREYAEGRRARYLNPIRMYVFISAIFFLVLYAGKGEEGAGEGAARGDGGAAQLDTAGHLAAARLDMAAVLKPGEESVGLRMSDEGKVVVDIVENKYRTLAEFDSVQAKLPDSSREHGTMRWILRNDIRLKELHGGRSKLHMETNVQHTIPKLMFVLLPLFALYVGLFYSRRKYYYTQHVIFSIQFHSFYFLIMMVGVLIGRLSDSVWLSLGLPALVFMLSIIYLVAALKNRFQQSWGLSILKGAAITALYVATLMVAFSCVMVWAFVGA